MLMSTWQSRSTHTSTYPTVSRCRPRPRSVPMPDFMPPFAGSKSWPIGEIDSPPIDIQAGPIPIILEPKIPVFLNVSGQISLGVSASMTVGAAMSWSSEDPGAIETTNLTRGPHMDGSGPLPGVSATATGTVKLQVQPQIEIYDAAGPNVEADADLTANVNFLGSPYFTLTPSISLKAGLDFDIADGLLHGSLEVTLGTFDFPAFVIESAPNATITISPSDPTVVPGTPLTFTTTRSDGKTYPVTWSLEGGATGDSITSGGVLTVVKPTGRTLTVLAQDSTGAVGQTTVKVGAAFDPVGDLFASQQSDSLDGSVTWGPPENTGGSPIASYTVTTSDGIPTQTTSGTSVTLSGLHPGVTYIITVYPVNTGGKTGPPATTTLQVVPLCTDTFVGGSQGDGTDWDTASNWSADYVPGPSDWVCDGGASITLSTSTSIQGLQQSGTLTVASGADLTVANTYDDSGTLTGGGTLTLPAGATSTLNASNNLLTGGTRLVNDGAATVGESGDNLIDDGSVLENAGTLTMTDGSDLYDSGTGTNKVINDTGGTIVYDGSPGASADIGIGVQDNGAVTVGSGSLDLLLDNAGGSPTFSGPGSIELDGTATGLTGFSVSNVASLTLSPRRRDHAALLDVVLRTGSLYITGTVAFPSSLTLKGVGAFIVTGTLTGGGTLTLPAGATSTLNASNNLLTGGTRLVNDGAATVGESGDNLIDDGSVLENAGTLTMTDGSDLYDSGTGTNKVINDTGGTIVYDGISGRQRRHWHRGAR